MKCELKGPIVRRTTELRGLGAAARRCGVSHTHLRKVLQGERKPSAELAAKMKKLGLAAGQMKDPPSRCCASEDREGK